MPAFLFATPRGIAIMRVLMAAIAGSWFACAAWRGFTFHPNMLLALSGELFVWCMLALVWQNVGYVLYPFNPANPCRRGSAVDALFAIFGFGLSMVMVAQAARPDSPMGDYGMPVLLVLAACLSGLGLLYRRWLKARFGAAWDAEYDAWLTNTIAARINFLADAGPEEKTAWHKRLADANRAGDTARKHQLLAALRMLDPKYV